MEEIWQDIRGYENKYQVSNYGRIKSLIFINNKTTKKREKILKLYPSKQGRLYVHLNKDGIRKAFIVHRLVAETFISNMENKEEINHIDGNPKNNRIENLEWNTRQENMKHAYYNNLNNLQKYNNAKKKKIMRNDGKEYDCAYSAARDLNVRVSSIRDVLKGRIKTAKGYSFQYK